MSNVYPSLLSGNGPGHRSPDTGLSLVYYCTEVWNEACYDGKPGQAFSTYGCLDLFTPVRMRGPVQGSLSLASHYPIGRHWKHVSLFW